MRHARCGARGFGLAQSNAHIRPAFSNNGDAYCQELGTGSNETMSGREVDDGLRPVGWRAPQLAVLLVPLLACLSTATADRAPTRRAAKNSTVLTARRLETATYVETTKLLASDAEDNFGISVAIDGDTIVIGAYLHNHAGWDSGAAYVFHTSDSGATYSQVANNTRFI